MKVLILAGGFGTRLSEETDKIPKPLVQIGGKPILWHIMNIYSRYGLNDFLILIGYKGNMIRQYFNGQSFKSKWEVEFLETGLKTDTGGRIKRAEKYINNKTFMLTYGDGLANINLDMLKNFHNQHDGIVTMTSVQLASRFGILDIGKNNRVTKFREKPKEDSAWINGGFFICNPKAIEYIENDSTIFEQGPLNNIAGEDKLYTYKHHGFWKCMDTLRDKRDLDNLASLRTPPWLK